MHMSIGLCRILMLLLRVEWLVEDENWNLNVISYMCRYKMSKLRITVLHLKVHIKN